MTWDFAPVTSYLLESTDAQQGILIVEHGQGDDGLRTDRCDPDDDHDESILVESDSNTKDDESLSYPESIPTEIGSLDEVDMHRSQNDARRKIWMFLMSLMVGIPSLTSGFLLYGRQQLLQRNHDLETEISNHRTLVAELQSLSNQLVACNAERNHRASENGVSLWRENYSTTNNEWKFKLLDNCWFKAELELRECASDAKDSLTETAEKFASYFTTSYFTGENSDEQHADDDDPAAARDDDDHDASQANTNDMLTEISEALMESFQSLWTMTAASVLDHAVVQTVVEQTRDAVQEASLDKYL
jgi:hypothetical protein